MNYNTKRNNIFTFCFGAFYVRNNFIITKQTKVIQSVTQLCLSLWTGVNDQTGISICCTFFGNALGYFVFRNLRICEYCIYTYRVSRLGGVSDCQCLLWGFINNSLLAGTSEVVDFQVIAMLLTKLHICIGLRVIMKMRMALTVIMIVIIY